MATGIYGAVGAPQQHEAVQDVQRVRAWLAERPMERFSVAELSRTLKINRASVGMSLARLYAIHQELHGTAGGVWWWDPEAGGALTAAVTVEILELAEDTPATAGSSFRSSEEGAKAEPATAAAVRRALAAGVARSVRGKDRVLAALRAEPGVRRTTYEWAAVLELPVGTVQPYLSQLSQRYGEIRRDDFGRRWWEPEPAAVVVAAVALPAGGAVSAEAEAAHRHRWFGTETWADEGGYLAYCDGDRAVPVCSATRTFGVRPLLRRRKPAGAQGGGQTGDPTVAFGGRW